MRDCTGQEICAEWLYHMGVPVADIDNLSRHSAKTVPCMMPYITAFFMLREKEIVQMLYLMELLTLPF